MGASATAGRGGGAFATNTLAITGTKFIHNTAGQAGGGIYFLGGSKSHRLVNALLARNTAGSSGAALSVSTNSLDIIHTTVASPTLGLGSAIHISNSVVNITNTIVTSYTTGIERESGTVREDHNLFFGNTTNLSGTITSGGHSLTTACSQPGFVNPAAENYRLTTASAAIDTGTNEGVTTDEAGQPRPQGSGFDMGYAESSYTATPISGLTAASNSPTLLGNTTSFTATIASGTGVCSYSWNFGDGTPLGTTASLTHTYTATGTYTAIVTATSNFGQVSASTLVTVATTIDEGSDQIYLPIIIK